MSKFVGIGPSSYEKRIYQAVVLRRLRNIGLRDTEADCIVLESLAFFLTSWISYHSACMYFQIKFPTSVWLLILRTVRMLLYTNVLVPYFTTSMVYNVLLFLSFFLKVDCRTMKGSCIKFVFSSSV